MTAPAPTIERRGFRAPGTTFMVLGGLFGALGAYAFQAYGGRVLGEVAFAPVGLLWTVFFILATVLLVPLEQYVTREVSLGRKALPADLKPAAALIGVGSLIGGALVLFTLDEWFNGEIEYVFQIVGLMGAYGLLFVAKGVLAGRRHFRGVGWVLIVESMVRLIAGIALLQLAMSATSLGWAMVAGGLAVLALGWWRHDVGESTHEPAPVGRFLTGYVGGTASSQILLGAAPIAVAIVGGDEVAVSVMFATFTLYRAPLTLIFALQGRILPFLVGLTAEEGRARLRVIARSVALYGSILAVLGGIVGFLVGADVVAVLYRPGFAPSAHVAMLAAFGVMAAAAAQVISQVLVAEGRTSRLTQAWVLGLLVAAVALVVLPGSPMERVARAFAAGEFAALATMYFLASRH